MYIQIALISGILLIKGNEKKGKKMQSHDLVHQLEDHRQQLAHYQGMVDELRRQIAQEELELSHMQPVISDDTDTSAHMTFREAMEFITDPEHTFRPVVRITDGLVIECCDAYGELSDYGLGQVHDPDSAQVIWDGSARSDIATYQSILEDYDGIADSTFVLLPREHRGEQFEIGEAGPFDYRVIE